MTNDSAPSSTQADPISLEPLAELRYPPFELSNDPAGKNPAWFDPPWTLKSF